ncbi:MAG: SH3 domain-containing protein [Hydrogenophilus sp.]|nr:SH3 domain-containing protein [Hydrogenophilus sp.]
MAASRSVLLLSLLALLLLTYSPATLSADFLSVVRATPVYEAPDPTSPIRFYLAAGTPVELIQTRDGWAQIRDKEGGGLFWLPDHLLSTTRTVITVDETDLRSAPSDDASILMTLPANAIFPLERADIPGWVEVTTPQGRGYIRKNHLWGW